MRELLYNFLIQAGQSFSTDALTRGGSALGDLMWRALPSRREVATTAIIKHLGMPTGQARALAHESFRQNCRSFMEVMMTRRVDPRFLAERVRVINPERLDRFSNRQEPAIAATAHLGSWELLVSLMQVFVDRPARSVVVRRVSDEALNRLMLRQRTRPGVEIIEHRRAVFPVLRGLKKGGMSAFLVDHNCTRSEAVFLPFLNDTAAVNVGPALLAVRAQAVIWPVFMIRATDGMYDFHIDEPLETALLEGDRQEKMVQAARFYTEAVERAVRQYPEQWLWMHKRWKTRPEAG